LHYSRKNTNPLRENSPNGFFYAHFKLIIRKNISSTHTAKGRYCHVISKTYGMYDY